MLSALLSGFPEAQVAAPWLRPKAQARGIGMLERDSSSRRGRAVEIVTKSKSKQARVVAKRGNVITAEQAAAMDRARERLMQGRKFTDSSADLIREAREERTAQT
jgi:hypothetical protein